MASAYTHFHAAFAQGGTFIQAEDGSTVYSYSDLHSHSGELAGRMAALGLKPGDRVMVQVDKSAECLCLYFACLRAGMIYLPLNTAYREDELAYFIEDAAPTLIVCGPERQDLFRRLAAASTNSKSCVVLTLDSKGEGSLMNQPGRRQFDAPAIDPDDTAVILYTSGTTGQPKGAMLSHANLISNARALHGAWGWQANDVMLHALPIFHVHGLFVATHLPVLNASPIILQPGFDPVTVVQQLPCASVFMGVPTHYVRLLKQPSLDRDACARMRLFTSGSAPLLVQTFEAFEAATGHQILERYGMTETGMNTSNPLNGERRPGTVGQALDGVDCRIVDDAGNPLNPPAPGNLQVRGPNVFKGYWRKPDKTAEEFTPDGWFRTGDLAQWDEAGYLRIVGRSKDMIISGGLNVYPKEIENLLDKLPGVVESAVIGIHDDDFGEAVTAVIVQAPGQNLTSVAVIEAMKSQLANFKVPKHVHFVDSLPRNTMGKVQKSLLRDRFRGEQN